jgi:hypothetical protein
MYYSNCRAKKRRKERHVCLYPWLSVPEFGLSNLYSFVSHHRCPLVPIPFCFFSVWLCGPDDRGCAHEEMCACLGVNAVQLPSATKLAH